MNPFNSGYISPPPAYTPGPAAELPASTTAMPVSDNDPYSFLRQFDTVFLVDDSGYVNSTPGLSPETVTYCFSSSMAGSRWKETSRAVETIAPICTSYDSDGIDIYFLNHPDSNLYKNVRSAGTVVKIFQTVRPRGYTPTGQRLNAILKKYLEAYKRKPDDTKPINIIVVTDGEPSDDVESAIIVAAKKLDQMDAPPWQVGIQFFQVGNEPGAREALKLLDDGLAEVAGDSGLRDIVDTVPFKTERGEEINAAGILKVSTTFEKVSTGGSNVLTNC